MFAGIQATCVQTNAYMLAGTLQLAVKELVSLVRQSGISPWFVPLSPHPRAGFRLFCFPHAGGDAWFYRAWPDRLPMVEVVGIQYPGRGSRFGEAPCTDLESLTQAIVAAQAPLLDKPFAFFGHSMGALVSFSVTRRLSRSGGPMPSLLAVSGCRAPQLDQPTRIHQLPDHEFLQEIRRYNGMPRGAEQHVELMELLLPTLRADMRLCETYRYTMDEPLQVPLFACGGAVDPMVPPGALLAWAVQSTGPFTHRLFPGDHFYLVPQRDALLDFLGVALRQQASRGGGQP